MAQRPIRDQWESGGTGGGLFNGTRACAKANLVGNGTTVVKSSAGCLHAVQINTKVNNGVATVYDNVAGNGTVIAVIDTGLSNSACNTLFYDLVFQTGLTVKVTGANSLDLVVAYQ